MLMSYHLTYLEAVVTGLVQGVTELFPVSSLGHNVLLPALVGGSWASTLNVSAPGSPYLAFIVGLHVATAIGMIAYFWRDWLRIVRGFLSSLRRRQVTTPDQRLAWMIILGTIPVGIVGLALQKVFTNVFAKPELAAAFLAVNGVILLLSERMRRARDAARGASTPPAPSVPPRGPVPGWPAGRPGPEGYSQQPWQQQQQGPGPRYGQDDAWPHGRGSNGQPGNGQPGNGQEQYGRQQQPYQQPDQYGRAQGRHAAGRAPGGQAPGGQAPGAGRAVADPAVAADWRLSTMGYKQALVVGAAQILALLPGISRDGMVTVTGMWRGLRREDAVRFSFLLSAPVILAAGVLKVPDLTGPMAKGMHGPVLVGSLIAGVSAFLSIRFLTKYFSEDKSLNPFGIYCLVAGLGSLAYLVIK
jgi:undecaprenyl-diphosphatase